jgi:integrase
VLSYGGCVIGAVVFDVGECLVDETREYGTWADWLGVPRHVFLAVFGAVIAHRDTDSQTSRGTPPSASTLRHVYKLIRNVMGDAYRMELVTRNVAMQVKAPPPSKERRLGLDMAEAMRLLDVIDGERLEALYVLAMTTGLRRGELLALRWDDIDLGSRQLQVRRAMQRVNGKLQVAEPKTSSSRGTVVLPRFAMRHLREHKNRQDAERQALGDAWREHRLGVRLVYRHADRAAQRESALG